MKKKVISIILTATILTTPFSVTAKVPGTRSMTGTYYDYMTIITKDGHEWLLSDDVPEINRYMKSVRINGKSIYVSRFKSGQRVRVKFDTNGTRRKTDDRIISVKKVK